MTVLLQDIWESGGYELVRDLGSIGTSSGNLCSCGVVDV